MKDEFSHHKALKLAADVQRAREHPRTNAERIRNMTDEELAEFLINIETVDYCDAYCIDGTWIEDRTDMLQWLRKEVG